MISKSLENLLQAMSGVMFGKSPNGTTFAERERERLTLRNNMHAREA
ncbi:MAG: hypothetical protein LBL04_04500 [Bacteroidales bacterium]|nr:hypothetical protein [Bacteroidales bacterium]